MAHRANAGRARLKEEVAESLPHATSALIGNVKIALPIHDEI